MFKLLDLCGTFLIQITKTTKCSINRIVHLLICSLSASITECPLCPLLPFIIIRSTIIRFHCDISFCSHSPIYSYFMFSSFLLISLLPLCPFPFIFYSYERNMWYTFSLQNYYPNHRISNDYNNSISYCLNIVIFPGF